MLEIFKKPFNKIIINISIILFFSSISFIINSINYKSYNNDELVYGYTILSPDNIHYIPPIKHILNGNGYTCDPSDKGMQVRRVPGYSLFYGIHYLIFGEKYSFYFIRITQCFLFGLSVLLLRKLLQASNLGHISTLAMFLYGFSPYIISFHFLTITESIHPEIVVIAFYFFFSAIKSNNKYQYFLAGIFLTISFLIRPTNGLILIVFSIFLLLMYFKKQNIIKQILLFYIGILAIWAPWIIRNYKITNGEIILLEKYYIAPMDYGLLQVGLSNWWMCWGNPRPEKLLGEISGTINTVNYKYKINELVNNLPKDAFIGNNKKDIYDAFISVHDAYEYAYQNNIILSYKPNQKIYDLDNTTYKKFKILDKNFKKTAPLRAYFISPIIYRGKEFIFQSFSSNFKYLNSPPNNFFKITMKSIMYLLNISLFLSIIYAFIKYNDNYLILCSITFITLLFLSHIYLAHIEARYFLAAYPFMSIYLAILIKDIRDKFLSNFINNKIIIE